jgi:hypothetical protein
MQVMVISSPEAVIDIIGPKAFNQLKQIIHLLLCLPEL